MSDKIKLKEPLLQMTAHVLLTRPSGMGTSYYKGGWDMESCCVSCRREIVTACHFCHICHGMIAPLSYVSHLSITYLGDSIFEAEERAQTSPYA